MIINNGIISKGNNNINNVNITYYELKEELNKLLLYTNDKDIVKEAINHCENKDNNKLKECLKKLGKSSLTLIKDLGLKLLEKYIEKL